MDKVIPPFSDQKVDQQTDKQATHFWMANPYNNYIGNVAAGSTDSGWVGTGGV